MKKRMEHWPVFSSPCDCDSAVPRRAVHLPASAQEGRNSKWLARGFSCTRNLLIGVAVSILVLVIWIPCRATSVTISANAYCNSRCVVRTTSGNIYAVLVVNPTVAVFESTDGGASWAEQDAADAPSNSNYGAQSAAIDGNGIIHIAYWDKTSVSTGLRYAEFDTSTNTFVGDGAVVSATSGQPQPIHTAIAVDSNNYVHIIYYDDVNGSQTLTYIDDVGGSWHQSIEICSPAYYGVNLGAGDILIDQNNLPEISYACGATFPVPTYAALGNANEPASFTSVVVEPLFYPGPANIAMDSAGDTWILTEGAEPNASYTSPELVEHKAGDPWSTWQQPVVDPDPLAEAGPMSVAVVDKTVYVSFGTTWGTPGWQAYDGSAWSSIAALPSPALFGWSEYFDNGGTSQIDGILSTAYGYLGWTEVNATVWSVTPSCGPASTAVTVAGSLFGTAQGTNTVTFNGTPATVTSWTDTQIVADAPSGLTSGPIVASVGLGTSNPASFSAPSTAQPHILSIAPDLGNVGGEVAINGENLCMASVTFNGVSASPTSWTLDQQIVTHVPTGATTGPVVATVNSLTSNPFMFTVLGAFSGTVTNAGNGSAISGATVQALQSNTVIGSATTASDGTYAIANLVPGSYDVRFYASGFGTTVTYGSVIGSGTATTVNATLGSPGAISGKVTETDGTTPIVGAAVTAAQGSESFASSTTDSNGNYSITTLSPGTYSVVAGVEGFATSVSSNVAVTAGNTTTANFELPTQSAPTITYSYDNLGRLTEASVSGGGKTNYSYDAAGNLLLIGHVTVTGINPASGAVGTSVTITGTGFSTTASQDTVAFNGTAALVGSVSSTQIVTTVPAGATTGPISVTSPLGSATSSSSFTVIPVTITGFSPTSGKVGTTVTITGVGFSADPSQDRVYFNGLAASTSSATTTQIVTSVPRFATTGIIVVSTPWGSAASSSPFTVTKH